MTIDLKDMIEVHYFHFLEDLKPPGFNNGAEGEFLCLESVRNPECVEEGFDIVLNLSNFRKAAEAQGAWWTNEEQLRRVSNDLKRAGSGEPFVGASSASKMLTSGDSELHNPSATPQDVYSAGAAEGQCETKEEGGK